MIGMIYADHLYYISNCNKWGGGSQWFIENLLLDGAAALCQVLISVKNQHFLAFFNCNFFDKLTE